MASDNLDRTQKRREPSGQVMAISGPYQTQSTESLRTFIAKMDSARACPERDYAIKRALKFIADRKAGLDEEPTSRQGVDLPVSRSWQQRRNPPQGG